MGAILQNISYVIMGLLAFGLLVVGHEFGHFMLAKLNDVRVDEFSIGMGPKLFGIKGKETEYMIKALPIGGYVKMYGEEDDVTTTDSRAYANKSSWQKLSIVSAGPIMNIILAIILFSIVGKIQGFQIPTVDKVEKNTPAYVAGIRSGDIIKEVDGNKIVTWDDFVTNIVTGKGEEVTITVERDGVVEDYKVKPEFNAERNQYLVGIGGAFKTPTFTESVKYGLDQTLSMAKQTFKFFGQLFQGKISKDDVGGPITIIKVTGKVAKAGLTTLMFFIAYLSVQLAIFNIIPFPALDGGWIFLLLLQIITRKEFNKEKVATINYYGFMILMALMVIVLIKDIVSPIQF
ncbi:MAG: RIP metalloprotease RseP [Clostridium argentinense]|uniref:Zinc metalloprotease n=1 Tax=Clostridium faecium TaxID=2762223 RepID=A0ABR8YV48_9CLOT|nr:MULTISPECIES: RIP metalloprotease RseP [Clostridium]MBD8048110.1 RIP metalloprotease RseP [Clostridium faecium]MBS5823751.1 RIP metalloprotease RseP [Clostridium argentinense]MDU1348157.1 RIP metalloprotease RseP [Clostridium argentinense]